MPLHCFLFPAIDAKRRSNSGSGSAKNFGRVHDEPKTRGSRTGRVPRQIRVPINRVTQILRGRRSITGDTALRLAHFFVTSAEFWLNLQSLYEIRLAQQKSAAASSPCLRLRISLLGTPKL